MTVETWEPGNGTRYEVMLVEEANTYVFVWLNAPKYGRALRIGKDTFLHVSYFGDKLGYYNEADLFALMRWMDTKTPKFETHKEDNA
jgi:hypothetical protein